ncbi:tetratricopeptide repeat-containing serine protease family protein [Pleurocapsa sp. PCC 7319]|uniref:tetratricopeptide repeat-containing S1 family peptidase n=1 Tax=Pleurocapsa sp. PCC 7319 TaxID=118161 RepID=UPI00034B5852|nr:tetratricopeptide repeat-containing serine protease family protein [Pleurocapsa sp. PCC 7319]
MNRRYLSFILFGVCLLPASVLYLSGCQAQTSIEQNSNSDSNLASDLGSEQVIPQAELSGMAAKIKVIAEPITVRIDVSNGNGSGVIIAHQGETYYVLTAEHVVAKEQEYKIVASDGKQYSLDYSKVKKIAGSDLAVAQFTSKQDYQIATLGDYKTRRETMMEELWATNSDPETSKAASEEILRKYDPIHLESRNLVPWLFLFGWQRQQDSSQPRLTAGRDFTDRINFLSEEDKATTAFKDISAFTQAKGYQLSYTNFSQGGMSGGAVLDNQGRVVGIHAAAEGERVGLREIQLGLSLGVPIQIFLDSVEQAGIKPEWLKIETSLPPLITAADETAITESLFEVIPPTANAKATDWINYGNKLWRLFRNEEAIVAFDKAIVLQPDLAQAHYGKAISLKTKEEVAFVDQEQLDRELNEDEFELDRATYEAAIASFKKTTELDPNFEPAWREQAQLLEELGEKSEALAAYDRAITLNPNNDLLHHSRGSLLSQSYRLSEAIEAYNSAISIEPNNPLYYLSRSMAYLMKGNSQQVKTDMERVRAIKPELVDEQSWSDLLESLSNSENLPNRENNLNDLKNSPDYEKLLQNLPDPDNLPDLENIK